MRLKIMILILSAFVLAILGMFSIRIAYLLPQYFDIYFFFGLSLLAIGFLLLMEGIKETEKETGSRKKEGIIMTEKDAENEDIELIKLPEEEQLEEEKLCDHCYTNLPVWQNEVGDLLCEGCHAAVIDAWTPYKEKPDFLELFAITLKQAAMIYRKHRKEKGDSWQTEDITWLEERLANEIVEFQDATTADSKFREIQDVINFSLMLGERWYEQYVEEFSINITRDRI